MFRIKNNRRTLTLTKSQTLLKLFTLNFFNKILRGVLYLPLFLFIPKTNAQVLPSEPVRELLQGNGGEDIIFDLAENTQGEVAAIGTASKGKFGGSDIFFFNINKKLEPTQKDNIQYIGRSSDDGATFIKQGYDGRWLVAGYSTMPSRNAKDATQRSKYKGKRDGWFLIVDEKGKLIKEKILGDPKEDDVFNGVFPLKDGGFLLSGNSGKEAWVVRLDKKNNVVWEKKLNFQSLPAQIRAATCTADEKLFFVGTLEELGENKMWLGGISAEGDKIFDKIFPVSQATEGASIIELDKKTLGICGYHTHQENRENGFFCTIDHAGNLIHYNSIGGREQDRLSDLTLLFNGDIALTGHSNSFARGARRTSAWTIILDKKGQFKNDKKRDEQYYGSKMTDAATTLLERSDGSLLAAGYSSKKLFKAEQAWVFQLTPKPKNKPKVKEPRITLEPVMYPNDKELSPNERSFLTFLLENDNTEGITDAQIRLQKGRTIQTLDLGVIPPQSKQRFGLPIETDMVNEKGEIAFEIIQDNNLIMPYRSVAVNKGKAKEPLLVLKVEPQTFETGKASDIVFTVKNEGNAIANNVQVLINSSNQLKLPPQYLVGSLGEHEEKRFTIASNVAGLGTAQLSVRVGDEFFKYTDSVQLSIPIVSRTVTKTDTVTSTQPKQNFINAIWLAPNPDQYERKEIVWQEAEITVQVKGISSKNLDKQHFSLEINGDNSRNGAKFDEVSLRGSNNSRTFQQTLKLKEGVNTIKGVLKNEVGTAETETLKIIYAPRKPNLHILAIGVPQPDLKYTVKDGRDFVKTLMNNQNKAFQTVFADTLFNENNTTKTEILKTMKRLQYRFMDKQIQPNDMLIVFISSHGLAPKAGEFRIAAGDYDSPFMQETSLDFEKEIVDYLNTIGCSKLFLLDACHSAESGISNTTAYPLAHKGINLLVSCKANEYSYEDDKWQNSAFTKALIQGFEAFKTSENMDGNNDNALDVQELFRYVERQVPQLVNQKRPKTSTEQHPVLMTDNMARPLILFSK
jgi:Caspase domain